MNSNDKKVTFFGFGILFLMLFISVIFGSNASSSEDGGRSSSDSPFMDMTLSNGDQKSSGELDEGASNQIDIMVEGGIVKNITVTLTWNDENSIPGRPRVRQYTNQPEDFSVSVSDSTDNFTKSGSGSNSVGDQGEIVVEISLADEDLAPFIDMETLLSTWMVEVTLENSGAWTPRLGVVDISDGSNQYSLEIEYEFYDVLGTMTEGEE